MTTELSFTTQWLLGDQAVRTNASSVNLFFHQVVKLQHVHDADCDFLGERLTGYAIDWLDAQCSAGRIAWARLRMQAGADPGKGGRAPVRATPLVLLPRRELGRWAALAGAYPAVEGLSSRALKVVDALRAQGAS